jgi:hypothetical protein
VNKRLVEFKLEDGSPVYVEVEEVVTGGQKVAVNPQGIDQAQVHFLDAIKRIKPAAEAVLGVFQGANGPNEVDLEFGIKLTAKAGAIFTSLEGDATFKVTLKWKK